jgi:V8-like Glu-specific endopeptidase
MYFNHRSFSLSPIIAGLVLLSYAPTHWAEEPLVIDDMTQLESWLDDSRREPVNDNWNGKEGRDDDQGFTENGPFDETRLEGYDQVTGETLELYADSGGDSGSHRDGAEVSVESLQALLHGDGQETIQQSDESSDYTPAFSDEWEQESFAEPYDEPSLETRIGGEDRKPVDIKAYPYRAIGSVELGPKGSSKPTGTCTGSLVGSRIVLTNGHCVWDKSAKQWNRIHAFIPGLKKNTAPFGRYQVQRIYVSSDYQKGREGVDFAFLILKKPAGKKLGWLGTKVFSKSLLKKKKWVLSGYPTNYTGNPFSNNLQVAHIGCSVLQMARKVKQGPLYHDCDSGAGSSGSPLFSYWQRLPYVVAVNYAEWGPGGDNRMSSCARPRVGECFNLAASGDIWIPTLIQLLKKHPN